MALTPSSIGRGRALTSSIEKEGNNIADKIQELIQKLVADADFEKFCTETPLGNDVFEQLKALQAIITGQVVGAITGVAGITRSFLNNQEAINAGGSGVESAPPSAPLY